MENELSIEHCMSFNWITTIAFYAALHLVEGKLAEDALKYLSDIEKEIIL